MSVMVQIPTPSLPCHMTLSTLLRFSSSTVSVKQDYGKLPKRTHKNTIAEQIPKSTISSDSK